MDEAANEEVMRINREVLRILDEYWSKPDNLGPEVWAEIEKAMADPCGHLEEISRLRAENDKANKGLERAGEIETTLRAALREADEREARWRDTFAEEMAHTMEQYEALGLDTEAVKERPIHELMMGRIAALREAEGDLASVTDFLNTWAREDGTERLVLYDKAVKALSGPSPLGAVRRVVEAWWNHEPHDVEVHEAMDNLRVTFGLAGEERG